MGRLGNISTPLIAFFCSATLISVLEITQVFLLNNHLNVSKISSGLAEGQVLQRLSTGRGANVEITGITSKGGIVLATISGKKTLNGWKFRAVGKADQRTFLAKLKNIPVGGPYRLELTLKSGRILVMVKEFFVGDVWIMAGQSNMEGAGNRENAATPHPLVRSLSMRREWRLAKDSLHVLTESPDVCHNNGGQCTSQEGDRLRDQSPKGVGVGVFFGREMLERSGVPQGLISAAHGGTTMQQWSPADKHKGVDSLYASMLESWKITGQPVAGILWHQGEGDATLAGAPLYTTRMRELVAASRLDLKQPNLPWLVVQIARFIRERTLDTPAWNAIQDAQRLLPRAIRNLETVAAIDLELDDLIHISGADFPRLANRLARAADRLVYRSKEKRPPQLKKIFHSVSALGDKLIDVEFSEIEGKLVSAGAARGFTILDGEGNEQFLIFKTTLHGSIARLHLTRSPAEKLFLSYGHGEMPACTISDERDMSLPVFGPILISKPKAILPFVRKWKITKIVQNASPLDRIRLKEILAYPTRKKTYGSDGFVNERETWKGKSGQGYFHAQIELPEPMRLDFLMGYDGPFRLWLDGKPFFANLKGTNPAFADQSQKGASLKAGRHEITVGMDLNNGGTWGFFLRFQRKDVTLAQIEEGRYTHPIYLI